MQYWLHVGMLIVGVGLMKLVAYQAWSAMRQRGNTIDILGLNIGALKGSASDAANLLLLRRGNRSLGVFVLIHVAIISAISLVVGKSITTVTDTGSVELQFDYPMNISILNVDLANPQSSPQLGGAIYDATQNWFTNGTTNSTFNETFSGTFIIQDGRAEYGQPFGQQIGGSVSCISPSAVTSLNSSDANVINITVPMTANYSESFLVDLPYPYMMMTTGKLLGKYLPRHEPPLHLVYSYRWNHPQCDGSQQPRLGYQPIH